MHAFEQESQKLVVTVQATEDKHKRPKVHNKVVCTEEERRGVQVQGGGGDGGREEVILKMIEGILLNIKSAN